MVNIFNVICADICINIHIKKVPQNVHSGYLGGGGLDISVFTFAFLVLFQMLNNETCVTSLL